PLDEGERAALRRGEACERLHDEVVLVDVAVALADLHLVPEVERDAGDVEAGAEVRCRCRSANPHAASLSVASGSLRPWPVRTQTTEPVAPTEATPAADAGSQNTPSSRATRRHACSSSSSVSATATPPERWSTPSTSRRCTGSPMR